MEISRSDQLLELIMSKAVVIDHHFDSTDPTLLTPNGQACKWIIDMRQVFLDPVGINNVAELFWDQFYEPIKNGDRFQIGGLEMGALPLIAGIQMYAMNHFGWSINGFAVRKERKNYGLTKLVEGAVNDLPIILVDDLLNSAGTLEKSRVVLESIGKTVREAFVVVDYENPYGRDWSVRNNIPVKSLYKLNDLGLTRRFGPVNRCDFYHMWHLPPTKSNHFDVVPKCSPIVNETHVFLGTDDGKMICVDQKSGATKWAFDVPIAGRKKIFSTPVLHEGSLYFGAYDGCVYKLDAATGKELWKFSEATWVGSSPVIDPIREFVFIGLEHKGDLSKNKGSLIALSVKDGAREFEHFVDEYIHGSPAHNKWYDLVAVGTNDSTVICVDMLGRLEWTYKTTAPVKYKPYFVEDLLIVGDHNGVVHCLDSLNGKVRWTFKTDGMIYSTPLVIGEHIFIASADKHLCKLDFDGRLIKKMYTGGENLASPVLVKGKIYLGSTSGVLQEIDPESMSQISSLQFPDKIVNAVAYSEATDMFFVTTQDTALWAIKKIT